MEIQVIKSTTNELPSYGTPDSAGCDLRAELSLVNKDLLFGAELDAGNYTNKSLTIYPGGRALIPTGLKMAIPRGYEGQIRARSGLALKFGISVVNGVGTVDADYRNDIGVILINHGIVPFTVYQGDRIAQLVINKIEQATFKQVDTLDETERGEGGFGHTGVN